MTQVELARRANTTHAQISRLEAGDRRLTADWMGRIAQALGCAPSDLISAAVQVQARTDDVEIVTDDATSAIRSALATRGMVMYRVRGKSVAESGLLPGDQILVDSRETEIAKARTGDIVLVRMLDTGIIVLRVFVAPSLVTTNQEGQNTSIRLDSPFVRQEIAGIVVRANGN